MSGRQKPNTAALVRKPDQSVHLIGIDVQEQRNKNEHSLPLGRSVRLVRTEK